MKFCCPMCSGPGPNEKVAHAYYMLCIACLSKKACKFCGRPATAEDSVVDSDADTTTEASAEKSSESTTHAFAGLNCADVMMSTALDAEEDKPSLVESEHYTVGTTGKEVISRCVDMKCNTIWEVAKAGAEKTHVALEISQRCMEASKHGCKTVLLAPTVPLVKQHLEIAKKCHQQLKVDHVIGSSTVDAWGTAEWTDILEKNDVLITTPQLLLDVLDAKHLHLSAFGVLIVDECHHCAGSHPFARVFAEHYNRLVSEPGIDQPLVLGMSGNLVKRNVKDVIKREKAIKKLEKAMDAQRMPVYCGSAATSGT